MGIIFCPRRALFLTQMKRAENKLSGLGPDHIALMTVFLFPVILQYE